MAEIELTEEEEIELMDSMVSGEIIPEREIEDTDTADIEDTDQDADDDSDADTNDYDDGDDQDTDDDDSDDEEEYSLDDEDTSNEDHDNGDSEDDEDDFEDEDDDEDDDASDGDADDSENSDTDDNEDDEAPTPGDADAENTGDTPAEDAAPETDDIDYKAFYEAVAVGNITVNGKTIPKLKDPAKIIQRIQMSGGFSEKMAGFKQYRPFMGPLKERGMLENPEKFALAMDIMDGNQEAIAAHLRSLNVDPIDLEIDDEGPAYAAKTQVASTSQLEVEDTFEDARRLGIGEKLEKTVLKEWDDASFSEFVANPAVRTDLVKQMQSGAYDVVQNKIAQLEFDDTTGLFASQPAITKYRQAVQAINAEAAAQMPTNVQPQAKSVPNGADEAKVKTVKAKIADERRKAEYLAKAKKQEKQVAAQRRKAASVSKRKPKAKPAKAFDPLEVEGEELDALMESLISGGKGL